jgi:hypothetical protein
LNLKQQLSLIRSHGTLCQEERLFPRYSFVRIFEDYVEKKKKHSIFSSLSLCSCLNRLSILMLALASVLYSVLFSKCFSSSGHVKFFGSLNHVFIMVIYLSNSLH